LLLSFADLFGNTPQSRKAAICYRQLLSRLAYAQTGAAPGGVTYAVLLIL
jgi:hypothetical protein